jgi:hypothetical protein
VVLTAKEWLTNGAGREVPAGLPLGDHDAFVAAAELVVEELELDDREWESWARDFLAGVTERESAHAAGVHRKSLRERRERGLNRAATRFAEVLA